MLKRRGVKRKSGLNSCDDSEGEVVLKPPDMVDEMMTHPGAIRIVGWLKHVPKGREESKTARVGTQGPMNKQPGIGTREPMKKEHSQQQADEYLRQQVQRVHEATQCKSIRRVDVRRAWPKAGKEEQCQQQAKKSTANSRHRESTNVLKSTLKDDMVRLFRYQEAALQ